ncbi:MAG: helix-turn-helix domain-containing protein [Longimicrobiales bacterium]
MDVSLVVRHRLEELDLDQRGLARAAEVTESYISQLLSRKRAPPAPDRTDIYDRMSQYLKLPEGELARLAELQRREGLKRVLRDEAVPLFHGVRALILRKCARESAAAVAAVFETAPFGELERLVTQKLLETAKSVARKELENEDWLRRMTHGTGMSYQEMRVLVLEFLDTTAFQVSLENYVSFLEPLIESWDIDLATFDLTIELNDPLGGGLSRRFGFVEMPPAAGDGFREFLEDARLSGGATEEELRLLERLAFQDRQATPLFYYRVLQNLRDPLHFEDADRAAL